jgi:hypothetical protein
MTKAKAEALAANGLFAEVSKLIDEARGRAAVAVNAELTLLYWQVGKRIQTNVLQEKRADYGLQVVKALSQQLVQRYGSGWSEKQLRHCLHFAETFGEEIVSALRRQLSWTHFKTLMYIDNPLKRDFYLELVKLEGWSSRTLRDRMNSQLFERSPFSPARQYNSARPRETAPRGESLTRAVAKGPLPPRLFRIE